jgi:hypothetical protein
LPVRVNFSAWPYAPDDLDGGPQKVQHHWWELRTRDFVTLNIDEAQMGLGGDTSWGALPHRQYRIPPVALRYSFILRPFGPGDPAPGELAGKVRSEIFPYGYGEGLDFATFEWQNRMSHLATGRPVTVTRPQMLPWSRSGDAGLVDGIIGSIDYRGGDWRMVEGVDFEATVDLGQATKVRSVQLGFLLRPASAILLPSAVQLFISVDGASYRPAGAASPLEPPRIDGPARIVIDLDAGSASARFVRVKALSPGPCPAGRECAGSPARLAVDEIIVR